MSPTKDLNPASSSVPMAPLRRIDDPPNPRIWESRRPSSEHFTIYDDPTRREPTYSGLQLPGGSRVQDENQENDCPSEYVSSSEDNAQQNQSLNWNETYFGPRDAFGLPLNLPSVSPSRDNIHPEVNWPTQNGRQVLRPIWVDETEATDDDDWLDENLNETDTFDLDPIESPSPVSPRARTALSRHGGLHGIGPPRSLANSRNNVRRVLNFYADGYRGHTPEADDADDADDEEEEEEEEL